MLVKIMGIIDLIVGIIILFLINLNLPNQMLFFFGILIFTKASVGRLKELGSWIDFSAGFVLFLSMIITLPATISVILGVLVLQKGIFSFF